jgi:predicted ArsR family transcriptional regulator
MASSGLVQQLTAIAALDDPMRRALYFFVAQQQEAVSRDQAAQALGVSRNLAGFHLDRLAGEGLLETSFRRLSGRSGPGAGRPAKLYHRSQVQLEVSLPQRRYELAARVMAVALDGGAGSDARAALAASARATGEGIGAAASERAGRRAGKRRLLASLLAVLTEQGYEPELTAGELRLRNCPFHALVEEHKQLVCGMNFALLEGVVSGLGVPGTRPVLAPRPGLCCVSLLLDRA